MLPERYVFWNYVLTEHCLLADSVGGRVLLTVTPRILSAALEAAGEPYLRPDEAEADFIAEVAAAYRSAVLPSPGRLRELAHCEKGDPPLSVSFLALSVLAAYHMRTDDERTGRAYYPRVAELLDCDLVGTYPEGFDGEDFVHLWHQLAEWLHEGHRRQLVLPSTSGFRRFLAYPFAHVPLRQVDIDRLPQFFETHGYEPGVRAPLDRLVFDLHDAAGPWPQFTQAGRRALGDPGRRPYVVRQVANELNHWDGCRIDPSGKRIATIELWLDIRRRRAHLYLLARRPRGFPEIIEGKGFVFQSTEEGWYEPVLLGPADGELLKDGLRVTSSEGGRVFVLHLRSGTVVPLTPSQEFSGLVSDHILRMDTRCAVLCQTALAECVRGHLVSLAPGEPPNLRDDDSLPAGWCLFTDVFPREARDPPPGIGLLQVESSVALIPEGGLRLGRSWAWLEGAPPTIRLAGAHERTFVSVDGEAVQVDSEGVIQTNALGSAGRHLIEIGNQLRQRLMVLPGAVNPSCVPWPPTPDQDGRIDGAPVAVPRGIWTIVGRYPGQRVLIRAPHEGRTAHAPFDVSWAIKAGGGPGATALHYHAMEPAPSNPAAEALYERPLRGDALRWAEVIYQAAVRRPRLICGASRCAPEELQVLWHNLVSSARALKRAHRSPR